jgi:hypothetical protein
MKMQSSHCIGSSSGILVFVVFSLFVFGTNSAFHPRHIYYHNVAVATNTSYPHVYHHLRHNVVVIEPTFTSAAYRRGGFYEYYRGHCDTRCLTIPVYKGNPTGTMNYAGSKNPLRIIKEQGTADIVTDQRVTKEPYLLSNYRKVIVLHNEYVTQTEFDAITHHPNVLYLYPNALYALISYHPQDATITLKRGHSYGGVNNAFGWEPSMSTKYEYDTYCDSWRLIRVINGAMLNCYPEYPILHNEKLWGVLWN